MKYSQLKKKVIKNYIEIKFMEFLQKIVKTGDFTYCKFVCLFMDAVFFFVCG
jgi:hypothetical protein